MSRNLALGNNGYGRFLDTSSSEVVVCFDLDLSGVFLLKQVVTLVWQIDGIIGVAALPRHSTDAATKILHDVRLVPHW
jgi:hypothetical protein